MDAWGQYIQGCANRNRRLYVDAARIIEGPAWDRRYAAREVRLFSDVAIRANPVLQMTQSYIDMKMGQYDRARELLDLTEMFLDPMNWRIVPWTGPDPTSGCRYGFKRYR